MAVASPDTAWIQSSHPSSRRLMASTYPLKALIDQPVPQCRNKKPNSHVCLAHFHLNKGIKILSFINIEYTHSILNRSKRTKESLINESQ